MTFRSHIFVFKEAWILSKSNLRDSKYTLKKTQKVSFSKITNLISSSHRLQKQKLISWTKKTKCPINLGQKKLKVHWLRIYPFPQYIIQYYSQWIKIFSKVAK